MGIEFCRRELSIIIIIIIIITSNEILIKHEPLIYTRARRAVRESKETAFQDNTSRKLDMSNNSHKLIQGQ